MASVDKQGSRLIVRNAMTVETAGSLLAEVSALLIGDVEVDLGEVSDVDSTSISLMFEWLRQSRQKNAKVVYSNLPQNLVSLATLYGVLELIPQQTTH
jgi:phospholipid transport system transporter-binding protein